VIHFYRHAAASDLASPNHKQRAVSIVLSGGILAGAAGPGISEATKDVFFKLSLFAHVHGDYMLLCGAFFCVILSQVGVSPVSCESESTNWRFAVKTLESEAFRDLETAQVCNWIIDRCSIIFLYVWWNDNCTIS